MKFLVRGDHPTLKRPDKYLPNLYAAMTYKDELIMARYENVEIVYPIEYTMLVLGCKQVRPLIFRHPDILFDLDFTATAPDKVLLRLLHIFSEKGYKGCKQELRDFLGV